MNNPIRLQTLRMVAVAVAASVVWMAHAQVGVEYFFDSDPGMGKATQLTGVVPDAEGNVQFSPATTGLAPGSHIIGVRAYRRTGDATFYAPTLVRSFLVPASSSSSTIQAMEYFWDEDPGFGRATLLTVLTHGEELTMENLSIPTDGLTPGEHLLGFRAYSGTGWSPTIVRTVLVQQEQSESDVTGAEYFWDEDPGLGKGTPIAIPAHQAELTMENLSIPTDGLTPGEHLLGFRIYGGMGWSPTISRPVTVPRTMGNEEIVGAEYFWNEDPGFGKGTPISITLGQEVTLEDVELPSGKAHGDCTLFVRFRGTTGGWSPTLDYVVMVDAEGHYTLNAEAETDAVARNYQSLDDAFCDFAERGVGDDITLSVTTTNTDYTLDATTDETLALLSATAESLDITDTPRTEKSISFTAAEGSGNTMSVTTTDEGLPTVIDLFAHTTTENVALLINGTSYDFTAASFRHDEVCADGETTAVALSGISSAINASWVAQPHEGTTLSGYMLNGVGDLPAMTLANSGTKLDSLAYEVTLSDQGGHVLTSYTYYIYVHAKVTTQSFSGLTPAAGSSLDPGKTTLKWNEVGDAVGGYRLTISSLPTDAEEGTEPTVETVDVTTNSYVLTVVTGYTYTWTVTAIGFCDELTSPTMTLTGRLLPDLTVTTVTLPEGAEAGNTITVNATISNTGVGNTTETQWTDRLYYTVDSEDFTKAVAAGDLTHKGALAVGESYDVTFTMTVPDVESGQLRVFVATDVQGKVMESNDDNNRLLSSTAELKPFYVNTSDLIALRQLYNSLGGDNWNGTKWNVESTLIKKDNWSGVTFDTDGCVTAINLQGRGLTGILSSECAVTLPRLTALNLSRNALTGDPAAFVGGMTALTTLNLGYNQIDELSAPLPTHITSLTLNCQHRIYNNATTYPGLDVLATQTMAIGQGITLTLPSMVSYNHAKQTFTEHPSLQVCSLTGTVYGNLTWSAVQEAYTFASNAWKQTALQDEDVTVRPSSSNDVAYQSVYPARMHFTMGDANLNGWVDVNDVQRTLNYVIDTNNKTTFGVTAANTYTDEEEEAGYINIQDIVCTVNIVLETNDEPQNFGSKMRRVHRRSFVLSPNVFSVDGNVVTLTSEEEVAAIDVELEGVTAQQVKLLLNARRFSMQTRNTSNGVRLLIFSPTGDTIPVGTTEILRMSGEGVLNAVQASSPKAEDVDVMIDSDGMTGIEIAQNSIAVEP